MKDIKDYIGTKTAIYCSTQQEWDAIAAMDYGKETKLSDDICKKFYTEGFVYIITDDDELSCLNRRPENYTVLSASEFIELREVSHYEWNELAKTNCVLIARLLGKDSGAMSFNTIQPNTEAYKVLSELGVIDIWTTKVYAEKPKYEKGEWYYATASDATAGYSWVFKHNGLVNGDQVYFDVDFFNDGDSETKGWCASTTVKGLATEAQLIEHFSAAAKLMGYKEGVRVIGVDTNNELKLSGICSPSVRKDWCSKTKKEDMYFFYRNIRLFNLDTCEWAKIISPKTDSERIDELCKRVEELEKRINQ